MANNINNKRQKFTVSSRLIICILGPSCTFLFYLLRMSLSISIVAMVDQHSKETNISQTYEEIKKKLHNDGVVNWSESLQGIILGSYYYTYCITPIFGGNFAEKWGSKWICFIGILVPAIVNAITPFVVNYNYLVILIRIIMGAFHGLLFPALFSMFNPWFSKKEIPLVISTSIFAGVLGNVISVVLTGWICQTFGWRLSFYFMSAVHLPWLILWWWLVYDNPDKDPRISFHEKNYISQNVDDSFKSKIKRKTPWKSILTSAPVYATIAGKVSGFFAYFVLASKLPGYLENVFNIDIQSNGLLNSLVFLGTCIISFLAGPTSNLIKSKTKISLTRLRKIFQTLALLGPTICFILIPLIGNDQTSVIVMLIAGMTVFGLVTGGDYPIISEFAHDYTGTVNGLASTFGNSTGFIAPLFIGLFLDSKGATRQQWNIIFYITASITFCGIILFNLLASAEIQPWAKGNNNNNNNNDCEENKTTTKS